MPLSAAILRTDGRRPAFRAGGLSGRRAGLAARSSPRAAPSGGGLGGGGGAAWRRRRLRVIWPSSAPTATVSPSLTAISDEHAGGGRRHFQRHLVGFQLHQRLVDGDGFARLLEPFADGRFRDRFAEGGDADVSHNVLSSCWNSAESSWRRQDKRTRDDRYPAGVNRVLPQRLVQELLELRRCFDIWPTAGEAAAGRPA